MKDIILYSLRMVRRSHLLLLLSMVFVFAACTDEDLLKKQDEVISGLPATVTFLFDTSLSDEIQTRAGEVALEDNKVTHLWVLLFDAASKKLVVKESIDVNSATKSIKFNGLSGEYYLYAVANSYENNTYQDVYKTLDDVLPGDLMDDVLNTVTTMTKPTLNYPDGLFLMSGYYTTKGSEPMGPEKCIIPVGTANLPGKIYLKRLAASITFNIKAGNDKVTFIPNKWQVVNVPESSYLFEKPDDATSDYYPTAEYDFNSTSTNSFTIYLQENRKAAKAIVPSFINREDKDGNSYKYADEKSTYVILKGHYKGPGDKYGKDENGNYIPTNPEVVPVDAEVTYYVHLGNSNESNSDYNTIRNNKYTYNINVNGVNDIIVEVVKDDPFYPADGDVIYSGTGTLIDMDAHYGLTTLTFDKNKLGESQVSFSAIVKSPKNDFIPQTWDKATASTDIDLKWIKFRLNEISENQYKTSANIVYPGKDNIIPITECTAGNISGIIQQLKSNKMITVDGLLKLLEYCKDNDNGALFKNNKVIFTAYVDEYYYDDSNWKSVVNTNDREMYIICDVDSKNGSSLTNPTYLIRQKSIQTVYNYEAEELKYAWGIEWYDAPTNYGSPEGPDNKVFMNYYTGVSSVLPSGDKDKNDGLENMVKELGEKSVTFWYNYFGTALDQEFSYAYANCMKRNRDENGNGEIDQDEIKWYLPAMNQLQDYWLGVDAIAPGARLFNQNTFQKVHYFTNTGNDQPNSNTGLAKQRIFWAEEGSSTSHLEQYGELSPGASSYQARVRCVRNLGARDAVPESNKSKNEGKEVIPDLASLTISPTSGNFIITMRYLNTGSIRQGIKNQELPLHFESEESNRPSKKIEFYCDSIYSGNWNSVKSKIDANNRPCSSLGKEWRVPNQREYTLYVTRNDDYKAAMVMRTAFSFGKYGPYANAADRYGYVFSYNSMGLSKYGTDGTYIRCVRDVD